jgi:hypothetical protein
LDFDAAEAVSYVKSYGEGPVMIWFLEDYRDEHARERPLMGINVSEGLEHGNRCDFPGSGKSCNKRNTSRTM